MNEATTKALSLMVESESGDDAEWDQMPMLLVVPKNDDEPMGIIALGGDGEDYDMLVSLAVAVRSDSFPIKSGTVSGLVLQNEAFGISAKRSEDPDGEKLNAEVAALHAAGKRFSEHPDAVEMKLFMAADETGVELFKIERGTTELIDFSVGMSGRIPTALADLFEAMK